MFQSLNFVEKLPTRIDFEFTQQKYEKITTHYKDV